MVQKNFNIKRHKLLNGLEVLTIKKDTSIGAINVGIKIGALYETMEQKGISHFIEHVLFKGTYERNAEKLNDDLEELGGEYNAYTDYDVTVYTISCLIEEIENAVEIVSDMLINSSFDSEEIEKERGVILSEIKTAKDDIEDLSFKLVNDTAYEKSPLKYEVTGLQSTVKAFSRKDLYDFYKEYYTPENAVISFVSPYNHKEAVEIIAKYFNGWNGKSNKKISTISEQNKNIKKINYKKDIEQSTIVYLFTFNDLKKEDELPLRILNHRLGESSNSLLFREIREKRGLAYDIYTHLEITKKIKNLYIYTAVGEENIEEAVKAIDQTLQNILSGDVELGERDLNIMKKVHKTAVISTLEDSAELCNYMLHQTLENEDLFEFESDMIRLENLDKSRIKEVAKKVLKNPTIHILKSAN